MEESKNRAEAIIGTVSGYIARRVTRRDATSVETPRVRAAKNEFFHGKEATPRRHRSSNSEIF